MTSSVMKTILGLRDFQSSLLYNLMKMILVGGNGGLLLRREITVDKIIRFAAHFLNSKFKTISVGFIVVAHHLIHISVFV